MAAATKVAATATAGKVGGSRMLPLAALLKKEVSSEKIEKPDIVHGEANQSKKGEDFTFLKTECQRVAGDGVSSFSVFGVINPSIHQSVNLSLLIFLSFRL